MQEVVLKALDNGSNITSLTCEINDFSCQLNPQGLFQ